MGKQRCHPHLAWHGCNLEPRLVSPGQCKDPCSRYTLLLCQALLSVCVSVNLLLGAAIWEMGALQDLAPLPAVCVLKEVGFPRLLSVAPGLLVDDHRGASQGLPWGLLLGPQPRIICNLHVWEAVVSPIRITCTNLLPPGSSQPQLLLLP